MGHARVRDHMPFSQDHPFTVERAEVIFGCQFQLAAKQLLRDQLTSIAPAAGALAVTTDVSPIVRR